MSGRYAERTTVSTQASRADIERTLEKYGATAFVSGWDQRRIFPPSCSTSRTAGSGSSFRCPIPPVRSSPHRDRPDKIGARAA